jgi:HSF-type DNA-binding
MFLVPRRSGDYFSLPFGVISQPHKFQEMSHHTETKPIPSTRKCRRSDTKFPGRLHDLLEYADNENLEHIVAWVMDGTAFQVYRQEEMQRLLSIFLGQKQYRSFTRQLKTWHFMQVVDGPLKGAFYHPYFQKNDKSLCNQMNQHQEQKSSIESRRSGEDCEWTTASSAKLQSHSLNTTPTEENDLKTLLTPSYILPLDQLRTQQSSSIPSWKNSPYMDLLSCHAMDYPAVFPEKATAVILKGFPSTDSPSGCQPREMYGCLDEMGRHDPVEEGFMMKQESIPLQGFMMKQESIPLQQPWSQLPVGCVDETAHEDRSSSQSPPPHSDASYLTSSRFPPPCRHGHEDNVMFFPSSWEGQLPLSPSVLPNAVVELHPAAPLEPSPIREFSAVDSNDNDVNMMIRATQHQQQQQQQPHDFYHQGLSSQINDDELQFLRLVLQNEEDDQQQLQQLQQDKS